MKHFASPDFWRCYAALPADVRDLADEQFQLLEQDPRHPSLHFKKAGRFWSVRVGMHHRVPGVETAAGIVWFWIGTHAEYDARLG